MPKSRVRSASVASSQSATTRRSSSRRAAATPQRKPSNARRTSARRGQTSKTPAAEKMDAVTLESGNESSDLEEQAPRDEEMKQWLMMSGTPSGVLDQLAISSGTAFAESQIAAASASATAEKDGDDDEEAAAKRRRKEVARIISSEGLLKESDASILAPGLLDVHKGASSRVVAPEVSTRVQQGELDAAMRTAVPTGAAEKKTAATVKARGRKPQTKDDTSGYNWFNLKTPEITDDVKRDLKLLKMRNYIDPKRFYKASDSKELPKNFQVGTVVEGAMERGTRRMSNRERQSTIFKETFAEANLRRYARKNYLAVNERAEAGGKKAYKRSRQRAHG